MIPKENYIGFENQKGFRTDLEDYFKWMTGVPKTKKAFTPFIYQEKDYMCMMWYWRDLFNFVRKDTVIMQVWPGHYSCDCFIFTLAELKEYLQVHKIKI